MGPSRAIWVLPTVLFHGILITLCSGMMLAPNMTLLVYGLQGHAFLQGLSNTAPGFNLGVRDAMKHFAGSFQLSLVYIPNNNMLICVDTGAYFDLVSQYYYTSGIAAGSRNSSIAIIVPGCDESTTLPQLGREWNILVLSTGPTFSNLRDRTLFPTTVALGAIQYEIYGVFLVRLCAKFNWTSVALIYDISGTRVAFNLIVASRIQSYLRRSGSVLQLHSFPLDCRVGRKEVDYGEILTEVTGVSRIVLISVPHPMTRNFLVKSSELGWNHGEITWISLDVAQGPCGSLAWQMNDGSDETALSALRSVFKLEICTRALNDAFYALAKEFRTQSERLYNVTFPLNSSASNEFAVSAYVAVTTLALVLNESLNELRHFGNGYEITQRFLNRTFHDSAFGDVYVDAAGERQLPMCLSDFNLESRTFQEVISLLRGQSLDGLQSVKNRSIDWATPDGQPTRNEPFCGFKNENPACRIQGHIRNVAATVTTLSVCLILAGTILLHRTVARNPNWWKLEQMEQLEQMDQLEQL
ncbi:putative Atrial natriuretic peptide receptor 1 [Hypsibius exemplaris]|uniref:Atrial natriuretic peptide receptor 1 n=1 Tax=Hypsibius exemplaris TaxID=2072580 RepID=A0A1W0W8Y2_HYPEX|nr:putative Atrial natriuretic peptide receptor 1 [Hypsibius exemplaris]